jgi:hypothetical protein
MTLMVIRHGERSMCIVVLWYSGSSFLGLTARRAVYPVLEMAPGMAPGMIQDWDPGVVSEMTWAM